MKSLGNSLKDSIKSSELPDLASELTEIGIDSFLDDGIVKDIPVIGTIKGIYSSVKAVSNYLFAKKLLSFLQNISGIPTEKRAEIVNRLEGDEGYKEKVGEQIALLIDRMDNFEKPEMLAKVFKALADDRIDVGQFRTLATAIDKLETYYLSHLAVFYETGRGSDEILVHFLASGLVGLEVGLDNIPTQLGKTKLGTLFINVVLEA